MWSVLKQHRAFRHLFGAQVLALVGAGLATVALSLLAYDISGSNAGEVLGIALTIKMAAYVIIGPVVSAITGQMPRRTVLVVLDIIRALIALSLPFVSEAWHIYVLIALLQSTSAAFTPLFQSTIPEVLPDEKEYTVALSLSRLAYDLEALLSPTLAAFLLMFINWQGLFVGTSAGFMASALLVVSVALPLRSDQTQTKTAAEKLKSGFRIFFATPRLKALILINTLLAFAGSMVFVNTVVVVQSQLSLAPKYTAIALAFFGGGSMITALLIPRILSVVSDRTSMIAGSFVLAAGMFVGSLIENFITLALTWMIIGSGYSLIVTPVGRLLTRSANKAARSSVFATQFSLSHLSWLIAYPTAGLAGVTIGMNVTFQLFAGIVMVLAFLAMRVWSPEDKQILEHTHEDLPIGHPHLGGAGHSHSHNYVIDELHLKWPEK